MELVLIALLAGAVTALAVGLIWLIIELRNRRL